mmetsp:Transcript_31132/g.65672  ORF Transcript_31132/g.65672 Transcript_31132/m.65672 type:complete len:365 (-) Transcript_31132:87-1181(-)
MKNTKYHTFIAAVAVFALSATFLLLDDEPIYFADGAGDHRSLRTGEENEGEPTDDPTIIDQTSIDETMATSARELEDRLIGAQPETTDDNILAIHEWPAAEMSNIAEGTYSISRLNTTQTNNDNYGRVLLYVTSHMSRQHKMFLKYCWPNILARSALLQEADVAVYLNPGEGERKEAMDILNNTFADQNLKVYLRAKAEKQAGAKTAMYEAITSDFFSGYDWVIRLNPDVIIRDDSFLMQSMADPSVLALLINCSRRGTKVHTDFFVIKPDVLSAKAFPLTGENAELSFTRSIQESVLDNGSHRWIPDTSPKSSRCRAGEGRDFYQSPIVHEHYLHPEICSVPKDIDVSSELTDAWPPAWSLPA